jgi:hypothetical protein
VAQNLETTPPKENQAFDVASFERETAYLGLSSKKEHTRPRAFATFVEMKKNPFPTFLLGALS